MRRSSLAECRRRLFLMAPFVDSVESLDEFASHNGPGDYDFAEHSLDPFPGSKVSARTWGKRSIVKTARSSSTQYYGNRDGQTLAATRSHLERVPDLLAAF